MSNSVKKLFQINLKYNVSQKRKNDVKLIQKYYTIRKVLVITNVCALRYTL